MLTIRCAGLAGRMCVLTLSSVRQEELSTKREAQQVRKRPFLSLSL
jgi:hypothetical protein|eukprot:COSAG06_NODE_1060_length_10876_cov_5.904426_6_plen_46_part_00